MDPANGVRLGNHPEDRISGGNGFEIAWSQQERDEEWDQFASATPGAHHEQTSRWACVKRHEGWKAIRILCRQEHQIVGGVQLLFHRVRPFGVIGYVPRGPCLAETSRELIELSIRTLRQTARRLGVSFLVVDLPYSGECLLPYFSSAGFQAHPENLPPVSLMAATLLIDLSPDEHEILARMRPSTRRNIRNGLRQGVRVREGGEQDLSLFCELMLATCRRRGEAPVPRNPEFFRWLWREFHPAGWARLSIAEYHNEPVCAIFAVPFSDIHRLWKFGWSGEYRSQRPSDVIYWDSILWARQRGFKQLDLVQIDPEIATALASGVSAPHGLQSRRLYGPTLHKMGFGGRIAFLPAPYSCFLNPLLQHAYSALGVRLLRQRGFSRTVGRIAGRIWGGSVGT